MMSDIHRERLSCVAADHAADHLYRDLFENATDIVYTTDLSGHFLAGNRAVKRLLGYTVEEARDLTWAKLVAPYEMSKAVDMWRRHARGERHISFELDVYTKDGALKTFEIGSRPIFDGDQMVGFHGIARDVTERKRMQRALIAARRAADQANQAKSTFLANMSHEIRTPINGILGFISLVSKTDLTPEQRRLLEPVQESAHNLVKIIDDVLDLSRIEAGQICLQPEPLYLPALLQTHVNLLLPLAEEKDLVLRLEVNASAHAWVLGDRTRLGQIVTNLVSNAIKFTDRGHIDVTVARAPREGVTLVVADTGIGMSTADQSRLFAPFLQLNAGRTRRHGGAGLGLAITKSLVEAMCGEIEVASQPLGHTRVRVSLPLREAPQPRAECLAEPSSRASGPGFRGQGLSMLVVDDNRINRQYLSAALRQWGIAVTEVPSGQAAVTACGHTAYDLVLMDVHMADMDGLEATTRVRALLDPRTPVIGVSADVIGGGIEFLRAGMDGFLAKPVSEAHLVSCLCARFPERVSPVPSSTAAGANVVIDGGEGVRLAWGDEALWRRNVASLRAALPAQIAALHCALRRGALGEIGEGAHRIAGSAGCVGAAALQRAAGRLEASARGAPRDLHRRIRAVAAAARELERCLRPLQSNDDA